MGIKERVGKRISLIQQKIMECIEENPMISARELTQHIGISPYRRRRDMGPWYEPGD